MTLHNLMNIILCNTHHNAAFDPQVDLLIQPDLNAGSLGINRIVSYLECIKNND